MKEYIMEYDEIKNLSFEEAISQLEIIVRELESGRTKLDDAVIAYEKAIALKQLCENKLKDAQLKIEKIEITPSDEVKVSEFIVPEV
ncbi:MAG: exodeoxyribonuclease VII small subunit [Alphaproteobacteria bacterium]|nr:exodeoxyribonuclease VII small subunit [Alphaproteobacteria bacterium]